MKIHRLKSLRPPIHGRAKSGFTLIELLVSMTILSVLLLVITKILGETQNAWRQTTTKINQFRESRRAFDLLKNNISQATLNTYMRYKYDNPGNPYSPYNKNGSELKNAAPIDFVRFSEIEFKVGPYDLISQESIQDMQPVGHSIFFQAPLGFSNEFLYMPTALNGRGYFVAYGHDSRYRPPFLDGIIPEKYRYRLMEYAPPTEENLIFDADQITATSKPEWWKNLDSWTRPVADNVIGLFFSPRRPLVDDSSQDSRDIAPRYVYDSSKDTGGGQYPKAQFNQLPPLLDVVMVVLDEASAEKLGENAGSSMPIDLDNFFANNSNNGGFEEDLEKLEEYLLEYSIKLNYRIFNGTISMKNSKWGG